MAEDHLHYERCAFATQLHLARLYTKSHCWLSRQEETLWRVGFTKFAVKVLGEPVEFDFEVEAEAPVEAGQIIGWIEGFKAVTDLFSPMAGHFRGPNTQLFESIGLIHTDPFGDGWMYLIEGAPGDDCLNVHDYVSYLDTTIDKMKQGDV